MASFNRGPDVPVESSTFMSWSLDKAVTLRIDESELGLPSSPISVVTAFENVVQKYPENVAMVEYYEEDEQTYTYKQYYEAVSHVAKVFIKLGLQTHHGVGIIGRNSTQWFISHLSSIFAGGVSAGMYPSMSADTIATLSEKAECNILIIEDHTQLKKLLKVSNRLSHVKAIIQYRGKPSVQPRNVYMWDEIMNMEVDDYEDELKSRILNIAPNKCCALLATPGTLGEQKWAMLSHDNIIWSVMSIQQHVNTDKLYPPIKVASFQSLCHVTYLYADIYWTMLSNGGTAHIVHPDFSESSLVDALKFVRPTVFLASPKIWERVMTSSISFEEKSNLVKKQFRSWARNIGYLKYLSTKNGSHEPPLFNIAKHISLEKIKTEIGLDQCRLPICGGYPAQKNVLKYFQSIGISLLESYGMSECALITCNLKKNHRIRTVGGNIPGVQLKFIKMFEDADEEMCCWGRNVFMGYLKEETKTKQCFDEKFWFHTRDIGSRDGEGFVKISGRIEDLIITNKGCCISPLPIENKILKHLPCLSHCMVVGDDRHYLSVLLVMKTKINVSTGEPTKYLDESALDWCRNIGSDARKVSHVINSKDPIVDCAIQKVMDKINKRASNPNFLIKKWIMLPKGFSTIGGELGLTYKMKRKEISKMNSEEIYKMYEELIIE